MPASRHPAFTATGSFRKRRLVEHLLFSLGRNHAIDNALHACERHRKDFGHANTISIWKADLKLFLAEPQESLTSWKRCWNSRSVGKRVKKNNLCKEYSPLVSSCLIISTVGHCSAHCIYSNFQCHTILWKKAWRNFFCTHPILHPPPILSKSVPMLFSVYYCYSMSVGINIVGTFRTNTWEVYSVLLNFISLT